MQHGYEEGDAWGSGHGNQMQQDGGRPGGKMQKVGDKWVFTKAKA